MLLTFPVSFVIIRNVILLLSRLSSFVSGKMRLGYTQRSFSPTGRAVSM